MSRIRIDGPDGPEEVHLNQAEEERAFEMDQRVGYSPPTQTTRAWHGPVKYLLWLGACVAGSFLLGSKYFTPAKPWPDWLIAAAVICAVFGFLVHVKERR